ncbi:hypothetical protein [Sorangium sp. So ce1000]|uniref:hypothetical protein n=1 Tax=Sorangium sp. So ce1000 TaxID=3133325 RepID=UPI003F605285
MNEWAEYLEPAEKEIPGLRSGELFVNRASNRVASARTGRFVARLVPGRQLAENLARLPLQPSAAREVIQSSSDLARLSPVLEAMQVTTSIGALASVANLAVSCVGFALVLQRLSRLDAKLDELLLKTETLQRAVDEVRGHQAALSLARVRSAGESLDRALAAETPATRRDLAMHARALFQESKALYLELWRHSQPWERLDIPVRTALEMQSRFVVCAIGEIQAEFIAGDPGSFRHAATQAASNLRTHMGLHQAHIAFRKRSDAACAAGSDALALFQATMVSTVADLKTAAEVTEWTAARLDNFTEDLEILQELRIEPHHLIEIVRAADGAGVYLLHPQCPVGEFEQWIRNR